MRSVAATPAANNITNATLLSVLLPLQQQRKTHSRSLTSEDTNMEQTYL
jgi:hypothetical protein